MAQSKKNPITFNSMTVTVSPWSQEPNNCMIREEGYMEIMSCFFSHKTEQRNCNWKNTLNQGIQLQHLMALANLRKLKFFL